jgi:uncharacterized membrane protein
VEAIALPGRDSGLVPAYCGSVHSALSESYKFKFWLNVPFLVKCAMFGQMCHFWSNVPFLVKCAIFGIVYHFWYNVPSLVECAIFGQMCHVWPDI